MEKGRWARKEGIGEGSKKGRWERDSWEKKQRGGKRGRENDERKVEKGEWKTEGMV